MSLDYMVLIKSLVMLLIWWSLGIYFLYRGFWGIKNKQIIAYAKNWYQKPKSLKGSWAIVYSFIQVFFGGFIMITGILFLKSALGF